MPQPPCFIAFYSEDQLQWVAKFRTRREAKAFIRTGFLLIGEEAKRGTPFGPICDTKRGAFNSFDLKSPTGD